MEGIGDAEVGGARGNIPHPGIYVGGDCLCDDRVGLDFLKFLFAYEGDRMGVVVGDVFGDGVCCCCCYCC